MVDDPFLGCQNLYPLGKCRAHPHHIRRHFKNNGGLLPVRGTAIHFRSFLSIAAAEQKGYRGRQFGFPLFLRDLNICCVELPVSVRLDGTKHIPDDLLLPIDQFKRLSRPGAFGVT